MRHNAVGQMVAAIPTASLLITPRASQSPCIPSMAAFLTKAISAFDMRHNFVVSYASNCRSRESSERESLADRLVLSGITRFARRLPVTLYNNTDSSLLGTIPNGINNNGVDTPYYTPGNLEINTNPSNGRAAFNTALFPSEIDPYLGQLGNAPRRFFYGPGIENFDMALLKRPADDRRQGAGIPHGRFNVFNHAQFFGASAVNGNISSVAFGQS